MKIGDKITTIHGIGTIKTIEFPETERIKRYGILHDVFPSSVPRMYKDDIMYYFTHEVTKLGQTTKEVT